MLSPQIAQWVRQAYPRPRVDEGWLDACCNWITNEMHLNPAVQANEFIQNVEIQLLESNLCDSTVGGTGFPLNVSKMNDERIRGILVEVTAIAEIGHSAFNLQTVRQTRIERDDLADMALEEDEAPIPNYPRTMLRFEVSDGHVTIPAIEYRRLSNLKLGETPLGFKILLKDVLIRRGILFLEPDGVVLKGHRTEDRDEFRDRDFVHGLFIRLGKRVTEDEQGGENNPPRPPSPVNAPPAVHLGQLRSPFRELSEPPEPRPRAMDVDDDETDLPRKRCIPNPNSNSSAPSSSNATTLVASRFFLGSERERPGSRSGASNTGTATQVLARALSPVRGAVIDIDDDPEPAVQPRAGNSAVAAGKRRQVGHVPVQRRHTATLEEFDLMSDGDIDAAFLDEIEKVEKAALGQSPTVRQSQSNKDRCMRTSTPDRVHANRSSQFQPKPVPLEVITIDDEDEDDKENVPVPKRRVRRRISTAPDDDVIDLSD